MKPHSLSSIFFIIIYLTISIGAFAQYESEDDPNDPVNFTRHKGFHAGAYLGGCFPNNYSAANFDGYGFNDENKNNFQNSWMNQKINFQFGGGNGLPDQIALALGVDQGAIPKEWRFTESDMPTYMKYEYGLLLGVNTLYAFNKRSGVVLNLNFVKLNATGSFTMQVDKQLSSPATYDSILTFGIVGTEQRLLFQLGYQFLLTKHQKTNFFVEGGINVTSTQFLKNSIQINNLNIDLIAEYNQQAYPGSTAYVYQPSKAGLGYYAGLGLDLVVGKRVVGQIVYQPSYEKINIGYEPKLTLQHSVGLRLYYRL